MLIQVGQIRTWLYGPVDDARLAREQAATQHRSEQLAPLYRSDVVSFRREDRTEPVIHHSKRSAFYQEAS